MTKSARLAQLGSASTGLAVGPGFDYRVRHIFHPPVTAFDAMRGTSLVACGLSSYVEELGIYFCFQGWKHLAWEECDGLRYQPCHLSLLERKVLVSIPGRAIFFTCLHYFSLDSCF